MGKYFGTNGIRGIPGQDYTLEFIAEMSQAVGTFIGQANGPILVGHDVRNSSPAISKTVLSGVLASGNNSAEAGLAPTPAHQFAVRTLGYSGGIIVTASHNPPQYNGMKVVGRDGVEIARENEGEIESIYTEKRYRKAEWRSVGAQSKETRVVENYIKGIMSQVNAQMIRNRKFTIVLDVGNGAQAVAAPYLCERLGCKVITVNGQADGNFPGRGPEPTPAVLKDLSEAVRSYGADLGVAYDGDGDRSLFCDENGSIYWGDRTGAFLVDFLLKKKHRGAQVTTTVSTSQLVAIVAERNSASVNWTTVGSVDVSRAMINSESPLGLEENGGFFYGPHIPVRDGAMTTALIMDALSSSDERKTFSSSLAQLPSFHQKKAKFECPNEKKKPVMEILGRRADQESGARVDRTDGLKIWPDPKSWILLRPSGTEPLIRVYAESDTEEKLNRMYETFQGSVRDAINST